MRNGDTGSNVTTLQRQLRAAGFNIAADGWFGTATEAALIAFQLRAGLVADGIAGPKTLQALAPRARPSRPLSEAALQPAADRRTGFITDDLPVILYERHAAYRLLGETGMDIAEADALAARYPNLINPARGGYAGGPAEWSRLTQAKRIIPPSIAYSACSRGPYQLMG